MKYFISWKEPYKSFLLITGYSLFAYFGAKEKKWVAFPVATVSFYMWRKMGTDNPKALDRRKNVVNT